MRQYRFFIVSVDRRVQEQRSFQATDDGTAINLANGWRDGRAAELWNTHRRIHRWD